MYIYKSKLSADNFFKNAENPLVKKFVGEINGSCDKFTNTPIQALKFSKFRLYDETGDRNVYQEDYYEIRRRMTMFLLKVWLYKEKDDIKELEDILWAVCDEYTWALPAHLLGILNNEEILPNRVDLFAAETAHTICEALSLCGDYIHPAVKRRCINEVFKRVIEPFETEENEKYGFLWEFQYSNWAAVCGGSVGMSAVYLIEDEERLKKITDRAAAACNNFFDSCMEDGVCIEGVSYWMYAMQYYVSFSELLKERTGKDIVKNEDKMKKIAAFPSYACMENNVQIKFSDFGDTYMAFGIFCKLNELYGTPIPEKSYYKSIMDRCARTSGAVRNITWFNPELLNAVPSDSDVFLPSAQWAVLKRDGMIAIIRGGHNFEPHNHNDVGSYMFVKGKDIIADELGAPKYTKEYFYEERYNFLNAGSHGHSLPIVNGYVQSEGKEYAADKFEKTENGIRVSFADAYDKKSDLKTLIRDMTLDTGGMIIKDSFTFNKKSNSVKDRIITKLEAAAEDEKKISILLNGEKKATIELLTEGKISILKEYYFPINFSGRNDEYSAEDGQLPATIIEIKADTDSDALEISYRIY